MTVADAHCHFFSGAFFRALAQDLPSVDGDAAEALPRRLGWDAPVSDAELGNRWVAELDRHIVSHAVLIASTPGDETSVATAVAQHPSRLTGAFMFNPAAPDADARLERAFTELGLRTVCLFPAMHRVPVDDPRTARVFETAARLGRNVFIHCGILSVGVRKLLALPSPFDLRLGDPLAVAAVAVRYPSVPVILPHFGAGMFREALMAAQAAPNIRLDTSSSNAWVRFYPGLTLRDVFARALEIVGPSRLLFGTDSSFFPRGWQYAVYHEQRDVLDELGVPAADQAAIFSENLLRLAGQA